MKEMGIGIVYTQPFTKKFKDTMFHKSLWA